MPITAPSAGDRILAADLAAFYNLLKGVAASGEAITLIYNAAGAILLQPSSDPSSTTQLFQIKNAAGTVQAAIQANGKFVEGTTTIQPMTTAGDLIYGGASGAPTRLGVGGVASFLSTVGGNPVWTGPGNFAHYSDDFIQALIAAASATVNTWTASLTAGTAALLAGIANHPGIIQLDSTVANPGFIGLHGAAGGIGTVLPGDTFDMTWIVRPAAAVDANLYFRFGLNDTSTSTTSGTLPTNGIYLEKLPADAGWFECCRAAGTSTRVGGPGAPTNGTFAKWRIRRVDASNIGWSLDGGAENNISTNVPTVALKPFIEVGNNATANSKKIDLDLFDLTISGMTR